MFGFISPFWRTFSDKQPVISWDFISAFMSVKRHIAAASFNSRWKSSMFGVVFFFFRNINRLYSVFFSGLKWFCTAWTSLSKFFSFFSGVVCSDGSSSIRSFTSSPTKVKSIAFFFSFIVFYVVRSEIISQSVDIFCPFCCFVFWFVVKFWVMW